MSYGLTPQDFVQQVFYAQEKVLLSFAPTDDKYKEVIIEANFVIQELQQSEDWGWLRERLILGVTDEPDEHGEYSFVLPDWVYKPCTYYNDAIRLYQKEPGCTDDCLACGDCANHYHHIPVPYISAGNLHHRRIADGYAVPLQSPDLALGATVSGNVIRFNRPLLAHERNRVAATDVQRRIPLLHVCTDACDDPCLLIEDKVFTQIPDPSYMVLRTASLHAEGSPPAQGRIVGLQDQAQKILSAMRQNDSAKTDADYLDRDLPCFINIL